VQIKWVAYAASLLVALLVTDFVPVFITPSAWPFAIAVAAVPISIAIAVLRHRLYDIDRLISRTISYGLVTALLVGIYLVLVVTTQEVMPVRGDFAVAASTLAVAALFHPSRRRMQAIVDRRFNRADYDASVTIEAFSHRLRSQVDLDALTDDLKTVTAKTMQPASLSLWLRSERRLGVSEATPTASR
jgi:hypothetical protein